MQIKNSHQRYGIVAITLHWVMAVLVIGMIILGLYMVTLPISLQKLKWYGRHKAFGILILMLVTLRLGWRFGNIVPNLPPFFAWVEKSAAHFVHYLLYALLIFMPLTGWMNSSAAGLQVSFFGLFLLPDLVQPDENLRQFLSMLHKTMGYTLLVLICLHALAALQHHFYYKDDILKRMLP